MSAAISFDDHKARKFIEQGLLGFYGDPPDSDHQRGFMCGMAAVYAEGLGGAATDGRIATVLEWAGFHPARKDHDNERD